VTTLGSPTSRTAFAFLVGQLDQSPICPVDDAQVFIFLRFFQWALHNFNFHSRHIKQVDFLYTTTITTDITAAFVFVVVVMFAPQNVTFEFTGEEFFLSLLTRDILRVASSSGPIGFSPFHSVYAALSGAVLANKAAAFSGFARATLLKYTPYLGALVLGNRTSQTHACSHTRHRCTRKPQ
jgi:hypothetical protein